ncbi:MAG TPA: PBP1A family penicillin-binding protein [Syntrophorhabdales bacterium]|nr:PBP1A family penicillin-binding protein [Syntrophorhabdales bacterium]
MKKRRQHFLVALILVSFLLLGLGLCVFLVTEVPSVVALKNLTNKPTSSIYGAHDELVYVIVPDNRVFVPYDKIPRYVRDAFLAAEDAEFFKHGAVSPLSIARALFKNVVHGRVVQGGSTITQQVVKSLILGPERSMLRKVREGILAYRLERNLTKHEILNLYLNNIYMGQGVYGVEAASQVYFGKHIWQISRAEAALLAGLVQSPARYTPKNHPGLARLRQEYVIDQMEKKDFVSKKTAMSMLNEKIYIREDDGVFADSYFKNTVMRSVEEKFGKGVFNRRQLKVYATVDGSLQKQAEESIKRGLANYDQRKGAPVVVARLEKKRWESFGTGQEKDIHFEGLKAGKSYTVLITEKMADGYAVVLGKQKGLLKASDAVFRPGDVVRGTYRGLDKKKLLQFVPLKSSGAEGALLCMDVNTGYVLALVGGRSAEKSPYNRAIQAKVQPGSAFKPFIYLAALEKGYSPDSTILDEPKAYAGAEGKAWTPRNYDNVYMGPISLKDAIAYSKNAATVRLLEDVGIDSVRRAMESLGISADIESDLSIALGTSNVTLMDLVKGFSAFANGGFRVQPLFIRRIEDEKGTILESNEPNKSRAISPEIAYQMNMLLKGVTTYGTAKEASRLGYPVAGKTGTTSSFYDALFVGYSPFICTGVWVGFDTRTSLGKAESGGRVSLPVWMNFMAGALRRYPPDDFTAPPPPVPAVPVPGVPAEPENPMQPGSRWF